MTLLALANFSSPDFFYMISGEMASLWLTQTFLLTCFECKIRVTRVLKTLCLHQEDSVQAGPEPTHDPPKS